MNKSGALYVVPSWFTLDYHLRGHISFMKARGYHVTVVGNDDQRAHEAARREGAKYYSVDMDTIAFLPMEDLCTLLRIMQLASVNNCNVIYCCTKKGALMGGLAGRLLGLSCIVYHVRGVRGLAEDNPHILKKLAFRFMERVICLMAHRVVFISRSNMELYNAMGICPAEKSELFGGGSSNGVDTERFSRKDKTVAEARQLRESHGIPEDAYVIGFVGRAVREKGIVELHDAWDVMRDRHPNVHLLIVSPPETDCPDTIAALSSDDRVHLTGFMKEPAAGYAAMDCLVIPSHQIEGFGNVATEAGAMELPVVATRVTGLMDAVSDGETGLLVSPGDTNGLVDALERVISEEGLARQLGTNGRQRCRNHFRQDIIWGGFAGLYDRLAGRDAASGEQGMEDGGGKRRKKYA